MFAAARFPLALLLLLAVLPALAEDEASSPSARQPRTRNFQFHYGAMLKDLPAGETVRVWLPVPPTNDDQRVELVGGQLPTEFSIDAEEKYGNAMLYFEATTNDEGRLPFRATYRVARSEVRGIDGDSTGAPELASEEREQYLAPDSLVPIAGRPLELIAGLDLSENSLERARQLYDRVNDHMRYGKEGTGWGQGDVIWACDSRYGNCTDFHSLFISLARAEGFPARFEIGFPLPPERGRGTIAGYHCWAFFHLDDRGWVPVDISEADKHPELTDYYFGNLTEDRLTFSSGRDLTLAPPQAGGPLNFFIYPYAEVDGRPVAKANIELDFSFEDR